MRCQNGLKVTMVPKKIRQHENHMRKFIYGYSREFEASTCPRARQGTSVQTVHSHFKFLQNSSWYLVYPLNVQLFKFNMYHAPSLIFWGVANGLLHCLSTTTHRRCHTLLSTWKQLLQCCSRRVTLGKKKRKKNVVLGLVDGPSKVGCFNVPDKVM
ncbi:hypothetical protein CROQUDRAFT_639849 [Cronartium quercuum f. sp. fusiforme G11]|uniref:Uncharacterized protein n=1 Tax=Cronartium quercuum f. sp. fusiforme G11 TaxID=708437 RepID=A0A9P6NE02_9BASI|nr:hypothetical protein CROQUDRAFT_639849 [Cronartium quercuum f. sp. fusiforme G11]